MYAIQPPLTPRKAPRQARSRALVEAIIEATARIFEREGAVACTTNAVAETAGVSIGSLYQYFPNRHALTAA
ncbi:helix-turn-helix domain-containing protein, partial [Cronobacter sakazakii]|nr:helix-turn-helix domain-containing protein [Cronobacter sakazakii]